MQARSPDDISCIEKADESTRSKHKKQVRSQTTVSLHGQFVVCHGSRLRPLLDELLPRFVYTSARLYMLSSSAHARSAWAGS